MISEFREEYLQEILDPVFRHIALKTEEEMNLLSPDALYAGLLGALFGIGVESVDAAVKGLPVDFEFIDSTADASEYAEFADIFEDIEGWEHLKSLPKAEQEAFVESLFDEAPVEAETPVTTEEIINPETEISQTEDLPVEETAERGIIKEKNTTKGIGIQYFANKGLDKQSDRELQKSIRSWNVIIEKHKDKVNNPAKYDKDWAFKDEREKAGLVKHWEKEIRTTEKCIKEANELLAKRKEENK